MTRGGGGVLTGGVALEWEKSACELTTFVVFSHRDY